MTVCPDIDLGQRYNRAVGLWNEEKYLQVLEYSTENIALCEYLSNYKLWVKNQKLQAMAYYKLDYFDKSVEKYQMILEDEERFISNFGEEPLNGIKYGLSLSKRFSGDSWGGYELLLDILENSTDNDLKTRTVICLGNLLRYFYEISNKRDYLNQAINILRNNIISEKLDNQMLAHYKNTLGTIYLHKNETDKAFHLLNEVMEMDNNSFIVGYTMNALAWLYMLENENKEAKKYLDKAYKIHAKENDKLGLYRNYFLKGMWYKEQKLYEKAAEFLRKSCEIDEGKYVLLELLNVSYQLFKLHEKVNPAKAAKHFTTCQQIKEKLYTSKEDKR